jgi:hypothetical protein
LRLNISRVRLRNNRTSIYRRKTITYIHQIRIILPKNNPLPQSITRVLNPCLGLLHIETRHITCSIHRRTRSLPTLNTTHAHALIMENPAIAILHNNPIDHTRSHKTAHSIANVRSSNIMRRTWRPPTRTVVLHLLDIP